MNSLKIKPIVNYLTTLIILSTTLIIFSCHSSAEKKASNSTPSAPGQSLLNQALLNQQQADSLIQNYQQSNGDLDPNFQYLNNQGQLEKVIAYRMDSLQRVHFFNKLGELDSLVALNNVASMSLRISMAFWQDAESSTNGTINFIPLFQFFYNQEALYPVYPIKAFEPMIDWETYNCTPTSPDHFHPTGHKVVQCTEAAALANNWIGVADSVITEQLYLFQSPETKGNLLAKENRVKYYTFEKEDLMDIYDHYTQLDTSGHTCYFHLHLGKQDGLDSIPMRTILHLDDQDLSMDSVFQATNSTFLEFSRPCPKFCKTPGE